MASVINTNNASLNAQRNLSTSQTQLASSLQRLSSGMRINSAKDDAAGLAISERFSTQIRGMNVAARNANDGISLAQSAEGAMTEISNNLQRIRELAVQSRNATNSESDRAALDSEAQQLKSEIERVSTTTAFNGTKLLNGSFVSQAFQVGANQGETIDIKEIANASPAKLGAWTSVDTPAAVAAKVGPVAAGTATATGVAPTGTAGTPATATTSLAGGPGSFTSATSSAIGDNYTLTVGSVEIINRTTTAAVETVDAAALDSALTGSAGALTTAGITYTGTFTDGDIVFSKTDGSDFTIAQTSDFGTAAGSFQNASTFLISNTNGTAASAGSFAAVTTGQFTINGTDIKTTVAGTSAADQGDKLAKAINALTTLGVTATADAATGVLTLTSSAAIDITSTDAAVLKAQTGLTAVATPVAAGSFAAIASGAVTINGKSVTVGTATTAGARLTDLVAAINNTTTGITGVTASIVDNKLNLKSDANIIIAFGTGSDAAKLLSQTGLVAGTTNAVAGTASVGFDSMDIKTTSGADNAILAMDGALKAINDARANMGAIQNRFTSVVASLQTTSENLSASRSRILDTDFAAETANLTRGQILQQAGTAMLAQANSLPNGVLALLRG